MTAEAHAAQGFYAQRGERAGTAQRLFLPRGVSREVYL